MADAIRHVVRPMTILESSHRFSAHLGNEIILASEAFQHTGSFKFRAAWNVAANVAQDFLLTASSGNFGQALAYACSCLKKSCIVVMPSTAAKVKIDAVRAYGGVVDLVDVRRCTRQQRLSELAQEITRAYVASPYDDPLVVAGNATLGKEIGLLEPAPDLVVVPIGGGGLSSGIIVGLESCGKKIEVIGAEPALANDAARSLRAGRIIRNDSEPMTIADGARTISIGEYNWKILQAGLKSIVEVPEEKIVEAVRLLFELANLKVEPTGALSVAALMTSPDMFLGRRVCCVVSGGNVDPAVYANILVG